MAPEATEEEKFYILTHPDWTPVVQLRVHNLLRAENPQHPDEILMKLIELNR
jgi:hypothetical protein